MQKARPDRGRGRGGSGHGRRAKGTTLREHRARTYRPPPTQLVPDVDGDQEEPQRRFARRQLEPGPERSLAIDADGGKGAALGGIALREQTRRLLTEIPQEWDGLIQQTFDHVAADQALLLESLQSLFAIDLNNLADSLSSIPDHVYLRIPSDFSDAEITDEAEITDDHVPQMKPCVEEKASVNSAPKAVSDFQHSQSIPAATPSANAPTEHASDQELDGLLQLANRQVPSANEHSAVADIDSDAEFDRLLDEL